MVDGKAYPAVSFVRRQDLGGVTAEVRAAPDLGFATLLATEEVSVDLARATARTRSWCGRRCRSRSSRTSSSAWRRRFRRTEGKT